jgi:hypothetical protein
MPLACLPALTLFSSILMASKAANTYSLTNSSIQSSEFERFPAIVAATTRNQGAILRRTCKTTPSVAQFAE